MLISNLTIFSKILDILLKRGGPGADSALNLKTFIIENISEERAQALDETQEPVSFKESFQDEIDDSELSDAEKEKVKIELLELLRSDTADLEVQDIDTNENAEKTPNEQQEKPEQDGAKQLPNVSSKKHEDSPTESKTNEIVGNIRKHLFGDNDKGGPASIGRWGMFAVAFIVLVALSLISYFVWSPEQAKLMSQIHISRGFITYIFSVSVISLFLIITISILFDKQGTAKDRYERAKTILAMLVGIFGTVMGFYFGNTEDANSFDKFTLGELELGEDKDTEDAFFTIKTSVNGGAYPYDFSVIIRDSKGTLIPELGRIYKEKNGVLSGILDLSSREESPKQNYRVEAWVQDKNGKPAGPAILEIPFGKDDEDSPGSE